MKNLLSSGIYWLWEEWDSIKFPKEDRGILGVGPNSGKSSQPHDDDKDEMETFKPSSFKDTDIYLIFYVFLLLLVCSGLVLLTEDFVDRFKFVEEDFQDFNPKSWRLPSLI